MEMPCAGHARVEIALNVVWLVIGLARAVRKIGV